MNKELIEKVRNQVQVQKDTTPLAIFASGKTREIIQLGDSLYVNLRSETPAQKSDVEIQLARLMTTFPTTEIMMWNEAIGAVQAHKMSIMQLKRRVDELISNHQYPTIRVSDIVRGVKHKLYTYSEMLACMGDNGTNDFECVKIGTHVRWIDKREL
jgi:hypothetical protein